PPTTTPLFPYTTLFRSIDELADRLPQRLAAGPRVLKQHRGNGGIGVYKVELVAARTPAADSTVRFQNARTRDTQTQDMSLRDLRSEEHTSELQSRSDLV